MRIVQVVHYFFPRHQAGVEIYTYNLSKALLKKNEVFIFTFENGYPHKEYYAEDVIYHNIPIRRIYYNKRLTFEDTYKNDFIAQKFGDYLDKIKPDIIHFQHLENLSASLIEIANNKGIPSVITLHDYWFLCPQIQLLTNNYRICPGPDSGKRCSKCENVIPSQLTFQPIRKYVAAINLMKKLMPAKLLIYLKRKSVSTKIKNLKINEETILKRLSYLKKMLINNNLIIAPSQFLRKKFVEFGIPSKKIIYLNNGINKEFFKRFKKKESSIIRVGFIGSISRHKGVEILIKAFNKIRNKNIVLKIYGWGPEYYVKQMKKLAKKNKNIYFYKQFNNKNIGLILSEIDVLVVPSIWYENSPLVIHEAYMANIPVIASNIGGMAEYVKNSKTGLLFKIGNVTALTQIFKNIVKNPILIENISQNINPNKLVKSIETHAKEIENIYRKFVRATK